MLVLTRCPGESILIGDHIEVLVVFAQDDKAWLRVTAPTLTPPVRDEVVPVNGILRITDQVEVCLVSLRNAPGARVRLGITAPSNVIVTRKEVSRYAPSPARD